MRHWFENHLAIALYAPLWAAVTWVVYSCCGMSR